MDEEVVEIDLNMPSRFEPLSGAELSEWLENGIDEAEKAGLTQRMRDFLRSERMKRLRLISMSRKGDVV